MPIAPAWVGCAFAAGHVLLGALYFAVFVAPRIGAAWPAYQDQGVLLDTSVFALIIGYATAALAYARRGHEATLRDLRPALGCNDAELSALQLIGVTACHVYDQYVADPGSIGQVELESL